MSNSRMNNDILQIIKMMTGVELSLSQEQYINKRELQGILLKAIDRPTRAAYDLPTDAKTISYSSNETVSIKESRAILKGLYGYLDKDNKNSYEQFDVKDITPLKYTIIANQRKIMAIHDALKNWK